MLLIYKFILSSLFAAKQHTSYKMLFEWGKMEGYTWLSLNAFIHICTEITLNIYKHKYTMWHFFKNIILTHLAF